MSRAVVIHRVFTTVLKDGYRYAWLDGFRVLHTWCLLPDPKHNEQLYELVERWVHEYWSTARNAKGTDCYPTLSVSGWKLSPVAASGPFDAPAEATVDLSHLSRTGGGLTWNN